MAGRVSSLTGPLGWGSMDTVRDCARSALAAPGVVVSVRHRFGVHAGTIERSRCRETLRETLGGKPLQRKKPVKHRETPDLGRNRSQSLALSAPRRPLILLRN